MAKALATCFPSEASGNHPNLTKTHGNKWYRCGVAGTGPSLQGETDAALLLPSYVTLGK